MKTTIPTSKLSISEAINLQRIYLINENMSNVNLHLTRTLNILADSDYVNSVLAVTELFITHLNELIPNEDETKDNTSEDA